MDSIETESLAPRQQPNGVLNGLLRILGALMPMVGAGNVVRIHAYIYIHTPPVQLNEIGKGIASAWKHQHIAEPGMRVVSGR